MAREWVKGSTRPVSEGFWRQFLGYRYSTNFEHLLVNIYSGMLVHLSIETCGCPYLCFCFRIFRFRGTGELHIILLTGFSIRVADSIVMTTA